MSENTVILHISDLHFSSQPEKQREKQYIIENLIETLSKLDYQWKPQIVCIHSIHLERKRRLPFRI